MAEQITSLAQAQGILIEILVRLADQDANIAGMVMQSQSNIRALAQNSAYLQERLYLLEDKSYGIKENENLKDLNSQQRNILSGCLNEASKLYAMPSNEQRLYANELLNYLNADAQWRIWKMLWMIWKIRKAENPELRYHLYVSVRPYCGVDGTG